MLDEVLDLHTSCFFPANMVDRTTWDTCVPEFFLTSNLRHQSAVKPNTISVSFKVSSMCYLLEKKEKQRRAGLQFTFHTPIIALTEARRHIVHAVPTTHTHAQTHSDSFRRVSMGHADQTFIWAVQLICGVCWHCPRHGGGHPAGSDQTNRKGDTYPAK